MKKFGLIFLLFLTSLPCFSLEIAAGIGASADYFSEYYDEGDWLVSSSRSLDGNPFTFLGFVDLTYLQIEAGYRFMHGGAWHTTGSFLVIFTVGDSEEVTDSWSYLSFGAYAKYPFVLWIFSLVPFLGVEYDMNLTYTDAAGNDLKAALTDRERADLDEIWIKGGFRVDVAVIGGLSLYPWVSVAGKIENATDKANLEEMKVTMSSDEVGLSFLLAQAGIFIKYRF